MAINEFEKISVMFFAIRNLDWNVKQEKIFADVNIFNGEEQHIYEIKASNTQGNKEKRHVSKDQILNAIKQLKKYKPINSRGKPHKNILISHSHPKNSYFINNIEIENIFNIIHHKNTKNDFDVLSFIKNENIQKKYLNNNELKIFSYKTIEKQNIKFSNDMKMMERIVLSEIEKKFNVSEEKAKDFYYRQMSIIGEDNNSSLIYNRKNMDILINKNLDIKKINYFAKKNYIDHYINDKDLLDFIDSTTNFESYIKEFNKEKNNKKRFHILINEIETDEIDVKSISLILCYISEEKNEV